MMWVRTRAAAVRMHPYHETRITVPNYTFALHTVKEAATTKHCATSCSLSCPCRGEWMYSSTIIDIGSRWRSVVSFTPRLRYPVDRRLEGPQSLQPVAIPTATR